MEITHKTKQYLLGAAKVLVLSISFGYIYFRLKKYVAQDFFEFLSSHSNPKSYSVFFFLCLIASGFNWIFESLKWQILVKEIQSLSFVSALKQTLAALTVSIATPNRIGDYGAKAMLFKKKYRKKILALNLFSNLSQLAATVFFGIFGLVFCLKKYPISMSKTGIGSVILLGTAVICTLFLFRKKIWFKGFSILKTVCFFKKLKLETKVKVLLYSGIRYLIFSLMFCFLLLFFGADIEFSTAILLIFSTYFLVSFLPSLLILDVVIRGGVALWLFSFEGISEFSVLSAVFFMWIFNFVFPAVIGSGFVVKFQPVPE